MKNKKNYLLGFGAGIIFSSSIFLTVYSVYGSKEKIIHTEISNDEVIESAKKLGMIFVKELPDEKQKEESTDNSIEKDKNDFLDKVSEKKDFENITTEDDSTEKRIYIEEGLTSFEISEILEKEGIIQNKNDFDYFLIKNNVTKIIPYGYFEFKKNLSNEEVLNIIINNKF